MHFTSRFFGLTSLILAASAVPAPASTPASSTKAIQPTFSGTKCLTAVNSNNAPVAIQDCIQGAANQTWTISGSSVTIFGDKCLDDTNGNTANGQKLQIYQCFSGNKNQKWSISNSNSGSTFKLSGTNKCMDNTNGNRDNGNVVQIWDCTNGGNQKWNIVDSSKVTAPPPPPVNPPVPATGIIKPIKGDGNTCLTVKENKDNAPVVIEPCDGSASQKWSFGKGKINIYGNKCLDVTNGSTTKGTKMQVYSCVSGNTNQQYTITDSPLNFPVSKQIHWANKNANLCLDLTDSNLTDGSQIQVWTCGNTNNNQYWNIVSA